MKSFSSKHLVLAKHYIPYIQQRKGTDLTATQFCDVSFWGAFKHEGEQFYCYTQMAESMPLHKKTHLLYILLDLQQQASNTYSRP